MSQHFPFSAVVGADVHSALTWQLTADYGLRVNGPQSGGDVLQSVEHLQAQGARVVDGPTVTDAYLIGIKNIQAETLE